MGVGETFSIIPQLLTMWMVDLLLIIPAAFGSACPEQWVDAEEVELGCLLFDGRQDYMWKEARNYCQSLGADLLRISNELQLEFIIEKLENLAIDGIDHDWWTGATDAGHEGTWTWLDNEEVVEDFLWAANEPSGGTFQNCLMLEDSWQFMGHAFYCSPSSDIGEVYPICQKI